MAGLRVPELLLILTIIIVLFGASKLPQLGDALGKGIRSFRNATEKGLDVEELPGGTERR
jgi:sec-independent protein translocase protein TatA